MRGVEDEFELLRGLKSECGQEIQVLRVEVRARLLEEGELGLGYLYVLELWGSSVRRKATENKLLTRNLHLKPLESCAGELLVWCAVGEAVSD
jgi:hypothetical protein